MLKNNVKIKVCGLADVQQARELSDLAVEYLGFIFYPKSPRFVLSKVTTAEIMSIQHPGKIGVFVNESIDYIGKMAGEAALQFIQLHGDESLEFMQALKSNLPYLKIIKVFQVGVEKSLHQRDIQAAQQIADFLLFDTASAQYGGSGKKFEWKLLNDLNIELPYFLSGGIDNEHVENHDFPQIPPYALDINSRFEISPGNKDVQKIKNLLTRLRR